jgi:hypothetical protein
MMADLALPFERDRCSAPHAVACVAIAVLMHASGAERRAHEADGLRNG